MNNAESLRRPAASAARAPLVLRGNVLTVSAVTVIALTAVVLVGLDGWQYYTTPIAERGYASAHRLLRPTGRIGHVFGVFGFLLMLVPVAYAVRKKVRRFREFGAIKTWLDVHVFAGIVGPVLVTFHTSFKFNGVVSVAYWSMVAVVLSGFVGRYLYVRIPRSLRGLELTRAELDARALALSQEIAGAALPDAVLEDIDAFEHRVAPAPGRQSLAALFVGEIRMRRAIEQFRRAVDRHGVASTLYDAVALLVTERATLARRAAYLHKTKKLFDLWHVFHMPLVYIMFAIVVVHIAITVYMGYVPFMD